MHTQKVVSILLVLACLLSLSMLPTRSDVQAKESFAGAPPLQKVQEICAGKSQVAVGLDEKPLVLACPSEGASEAEWKKFRGLYLTYATSEEYREVTGKEPPGPIWTSREDVVPELTVWDKLEAQRSLRELRLRAEAAFGTEDPPEEVDLSWSFPPAGMQLKEDCVSWAVAYGVSAVQTRQFESWGSPWEESEIVSPLTFSRASEEADCSMPMKRPYRYWYEEGALTLDLLAYDSGDCQGVTLSPDELELAYPLHSTDYGVTIFARNPEYETVIGEVSDIKEAVALGDNVTILFGPQDGSARNHMMVVVGYNGSGLEYQNSWGADWNGNGCGHFTWDQVLGEVPVGEPFFSSPRYIHAYVAKAPDWEGECTLEYVEYDYRGVCAGQEAEADLAVSKSASLGEIAVGQQLSYQLVVTNGGPDAAETVSVTDTLPAGMQFVSASPECTEAGSLVTCALGDLSAEANSSVEITAEAESEGTLTNTVEVSSATSDPEPGNNTDSVDTEVTAVADLSVEKSAHPLEVGAGETVIYTVTVYNAGPSSAHGLVVTDTLPSETVLVEASGAGWNCESPNGMVVCERSSLSVDAASSVEVQVTAPTEGGAIINTAEVAADMVDNDLDNNTASAEVWVTPQADLWVTKGDSPDPVVAGSLLTYTITVGNQGPSSAENVVVTDTLPSDVTFQAVTTSQGACQEDAGEVICELGSLEGAEVVTVTLVGSVRTDSRSVIRNSASLGITREGEVSIMGVDTIFTDVRWQNYLPLLLRRG